MLDPDSLFHISHFLIPLYSDGFSISMGLPIVYFKGSEVAFLNYDVKKPVLSRHSKRTPKLVFKTDYRIMQIKSIAECSKGGRSRIGAFCNTFDLH